MDHDLTSDSLRMNFAGQARNLYISHLLSTWNARLYEFASVLFTASAYPDTLTATSIRGIVTTVALLLFSSSVGTWIDRTPSRLKTLVGSIIVNRSAIIIACICWLPIIGARNPDNELNAFFLNIPTLSGSAKHIVFVAVVLVGIVEKLSGSANMISMERDWVPAFAPEPSSSAYSLTHLNAVMRRIDLMCKLFSPIVISLIISFANSIRVGAMVVGVMSLASWSLEWWCALRVWRASPQLRQPKSVIAHGGSLDGVQSEQSAPSLASRVWSWFRVYHRNMTQYFRADVWMPSMALAMLHLSMLSYSAPFITHLLDAGFSLTFISGARAVSSVVEVSSTVLMPYCVRFLSRSREGAILVPEEETPLLASQRPEPCRSGRRDPAGLERVGLWGIWGQLICLIPVVLALWIVPSQKTRLPNFLSSKLFLHAVAFAFSNANQAFLTFSIFFFLSLSRLGLWTYDLTAQQLAQSRVLPNERSSFAGTEYSFVAIFDLLGYMAAAMLHDVEQFRWLALGSLGAVGTSTVIYTFWLRRVRGHLIHWEKMGLGIRFT